MPTAMSFGALHSVWFIALSIATIQCTSPSKSSSHGSSDPIAHTPSGDLKGTILTTWTGKSIFSFRGVPFAEPPLGDLRFKAPVAAKPWSGIRNATADSKVCSQIFENFYGPSDEDCLYLNVYTKNLKGNQPVIVFFHPGAFYSITGASFWAGPQYLLDHDIVLVTSNYRLDALGFFSTGDKEAVGNYGVKDQVEVLKWVQKHIRSFGGDPNKVTITGYSAGSTSCFLHMLSPMSRGLFQNAVAMSAGVTSDWVIMKDPKKISIKFAKLFNCSTESSKKIVECLRKVPAIQLNSKFEEMRVFAGNPLIFTPTIEPDFGTGEERFLTDYPATLIKKRQFYQVPVVTGVNKLEFVDWSQYILNNDTLTKQLNDNFDSLAPIVLGYTGKNQNDAQKITNAFKQFYFGNKPITKDSLMSLSELYSDFLIYYGEYSTAKLLSQYSDKPVYFYKQNYKGRFGFTKDTKTNETIGPTHHDDLIYLFYISTGFPLLKKSDPEAFMVQYETSFWKNFATKGNPTPDGSPVQWAPLTKTDKKHLVFDKQLKMEEGLPYPDRMRLWESLIPV